MSVEEIQAKIDKMQAEIDAILKKPKHIRKAELIEWQCKFFLKVKSLGYFTGDQALDNVLCVNHLNRDGGHFKGPVTWLRGICHDVNKVCSTILILILQFLLFDLKISM